MATLLANILWWSLLFESVKTFYSILCGYDPRVAQLFEFQSRLQVNFDARVDGQLGHLNSHRTLICFKWQHNKK